MLFRLVPKMSPGALGCLILLVVMTFIWAVSAAFWGWVFMVIAGALGWHIGFIPVAFAIGAGLSLVLG